MKQECVSGKIKVNVWTFSPTVKCSKNYNNVGKYLLHIEFKARVFILSILYLCTVYCTYIILAIRTLFYWVNSIYKLLYIILLLCAYYKCSFAYYVCVILFTINLKILIICKIHLKCPYYHKSSYIWNYYLTLGGEITGFTQRSPIISFIHSLILCHHPSVSTSNCVCSSFSSLFVFIIFATIITG